MKSKEIGGKFKRNLWIICEEFVQVINELDFFGIIEMVSSEYYFDDELINVIEKSNIFDNVQMFEYIGEVKLKKNVIEVKNGFLYFRSKGVF